jgi:hypothetical protein
MSKNSIYRPEQGNIVGRKFIKVCKFLQIHGTIWHFSRWFTNILKWNPNKNMHSKILGLFLTRCPNKKMTKKCRKNTENPLIRRWFIFNLTSDRSQYYIIVVGIAFRQTSWHMCWRGRLSEIGFCPFALASLASTPSVTHRRGC